MLLGVLIQERGKPESPGAGVHLDGRQWSPGVTFAHATLRGRVSKGSVAEEEGEEREGLGWVAAEAGLCS
jgi:hypothetical protein